MKKIFVILAVAVVVIASYFYVSGNPEKNKARKAAQKNFQISCDNIADALNLFKLGEIEKELPYKIVVEMQAIKKISLELVEEARKIGPTDEGYAKLEKAIIGAESLIAVKAMFAIALEHELLEELKKIEKLLKQKSDRVEI